MNHLRPQDLPKPETIARYCQRPPAPTVHINYRYPDELKAQVLAFMREGHGPKEAAEHFDIPKCTIAKWSSAAGIHFPRGNFGKKRLAEFWGRKAL